MAKDKNKNKKIDKIIRQGDQVPEPSRKQGVDAYLQAVNQYNPAQQQVLQQGLTQGQQALGNLNLPGNQLQGQNSFAPIAENAQRQFNQVTVPGLAERFAAMGSGDKGSSAFTNALGSAGADLQSQLAALGSQYGLQQQGLNLQEQGMQSNNLFNLLQAGLNPQEQFIHHGAQPRNGSGIGNFFRNNFGNIAQLGGQVAGGAFGGPLGAGVGGAFRGLFGGNNIPSALGGNVRGFANQNQFNAGNSMYADGGTFY